MEARLYYFSKKKLMAEDKKLTWQFDNEFIPTYILPNAETDGIRNMVQAKQMPGIFRQYK